MTKRVVSHFVVDDAATLGNTTFVLTCVVPLAA